MLDDVWLHWNKTNISTQNKFILNVSSWLDKYQQEPDYVKHIIDVQLFHITCLIWIIQVANVFTIYYTNHIYFIHSCYLTHCGLLMSYTDKELSQHWLRLGLSVWWLQTITYSISQDICTRFLLCCALLWLYIDWFSHIHQAYFTGTVAI